MLCPPALPSAPPFSCALTAFLPGSTAALLHYRARFLFFRFTVLPVPHCCPACLRGFLPASFPFPPITVASLCLLLLGSCPGSAAVPPYPLVAPLFGLACPRSPSSPAACVCCFLPRPAASAADLRSSLLFSFAACCARRGPSRFWPFACPKSSLCPSPFVFRASPAFAFFFVCPFGCSHMVLSHSSVRLFWHLFIPLLSFLGFFGLPRCLLLCCLYAGLAPRVSAVPRMAPLPSGLSWLPPGRSRHVCWCGGARLSRLALLQHFPRAAPSGTSHPWASSPVLFRLSPILTFLHFPFDFTLVLRRRSYSPPTWPPWCLALPGMASTVASCPSLVA